jgi:hypothetical protein
MKAEAASTTAARPAVIVTRKTCALQPASPATTATIRMVKAAEMATTVIN